jgi:uncharacterized cofD-like protein
VVYVSNVMTQPGETGGFAVSDHVRAISEHLGPIVTDVLVHSGTLAPGVLARYEAEEAAPVESDIAALRGMGLRVRAADVISRDDRAGVRHDPGRLAEEVCGAALVRL